MCGRVWLGLIALLCACRSVSGPPSGGKPAVEGEWLELDGPALLALVEARAPRVVLVDVWAIWCAPCVRDLPDLIELDRATESLEVLLISADLDVARPEASRRLAGLGLPGPYLFRGGSDQAFIEALSPDWSGALPARFLYRGSRQLGFWEGPLDYASLREALAEHLGGEPARGD